MACKTDETAPAPAPVATGYDPIKNQNGVRPDKVDQIVYPNEDAVVNSFINYQMLVIQADTQSLYHLASGQLPQTVSKTIKQLVEAGILVEMNEKRTQNGNYQSKIIIQR